MSARVAAPPSRRARSCAGRADLGRLRDRTRGAGRLRDDARVPHRPGERDVPRPGSSARCGRRSCPIWGPTRRSSLGAPDAAPARRSTRSPSSCGGGAARSHLDLRDRHRSRSLGLAAAGRLRARSRARASAQNYLRGRRARLALRLLHGALRARQSSTVRCGRIVFSDHSLATDPSSPRCSSCPAATCSSTSIATCRIAPSGCSRARVPPGFLGLGAKESLIRSSHEASFSSFAKAERIYRSR